MSSEEVASKAASDAAAEQQDSELNTIYFVTINVTLPNESSVTFQSFPVAENFLSLKQTLAEYYETALYTSYRFEIQSLVEKDGSCASLQAVPIDESMEIRQYITKTATTVNIKLVLEAYDLKRVRAQVKKTRDVAMHPPTALARSKPSETQVAAASVAETLKPSKKAELDMPSKEALLATQPAAGEFLLNFFQESLMRVSSAETAARSAARDKLLREQIKYIAASGWNSPPKHRQLQGDLFYIEVVCAVEGSLYISACRDGFYVNKSNKSHFDPTPHAKSHFCHELMDTIMAAAPSVRTAWAAVLAGIEEEQQRHSMRAATAQAASTASSHALDNVLSLFSQGRVEDMAFKPSWCTAPAEYFQGSASAGTKSAEVVAHTYDLFRAQEQAGSMFGVEELGAPREWIDEIRAVRGIDAKQLAEKALKAKFEYRIVYEFTEACKAAVVGICDGMIAPLSANDPNQSELYYYNNIFFSMAVDPGDESKSFSGDDAHRRAALHDVVNQRQIQAIGISGLNTVLSTLVDFKGCRYLCQTAVPGLLVASPTNQPRLLYGSLDKNSALVVKNKSLGLMQKLGKALFLPERSLPQRIANSKEAEELVEVAAAAAKAGDEAAKSAYQDIMATLEAQQVSAIKTDNEDNVEAKIGAEGSAVVPHVGPLECKMLQGTDGVTYLLEVMRLTPRDANFVAKEERGSGCVPQELLDQCDKELAKTYVIRPELVGNFMQKLLLTKRQELIAEATKGKTGGKLEIDTGGEVAASSAAAGARSPALAAGEGTPLSPNPPHPDGGWTVVQEDGTAAASPTGQKKGQDDAGQAEAKMEGGEQSPEKSIAQFTAEEREALTAKIEAVTIESLNLHMNPNVFMGVPCDADSVVAQNDEQCARDIAAFLWEEVLPLLTQNVREKRCSAKDSGSVVTLMHNMGINVRYLGPLADLAAQQEEEDAILLREGKQRVQGMPLYWRELLTIEALSRGVKHTLNQYMREDASVAAAPAATVASLLNHLFEAIILTPEEAAAAAKAAAEATAAKAAADGVVETAAVGKNAKKNKKRKAHQNAAAISEAAAPVAAAAHNKLIKAAVGAGPDAAANKAVCLQKIAQNMRRRFLADLPLNALSKEQKTFLGSRIYAPTLLRRICQVCGIRLQMKEYQLSSQAVDVANPNNNPSSSNNNKQQQQQQQQSASRSGPIFRPSDVVALDPICKTCEPISLLPEIGDIINASVSLMKDEQHATAYQYASEAVNMAEQITGPVHAMAVQANQQLALVLSASGDYANALALTEKNLAVCAQLHGLDSVNCLHYHLQCAELNTELGRHAAAGAHLMTAKYLTQLLGGPRHPDLGSLYYALGDLYGRSSMADQHLTCMQMAREKLSPDLFSYCNITQNIAEVYSNLGFYAEAQMEQTNACKMLKSLFNESDARVVKAKSALQKYTRGSLALTTQLQELRLKFENDPEGLESAATRLLQEKGYLPKGAAVAATASASSANAPPPAPGAGGAGKKKSKKSKK